MKLVTRNPREATTAPTPCELLAAAQAQMALLIAGKGIRSIETPQLGRVEFAQTSVADLSRMIDRLQIACNESMGIYSSGRRRPISVEGCP